MRRMRSAIASGFCCAFPLVSVLKCFSSVEANAAGDEKSRFLRRPFTKLVPDRTRVPAGLFATLAIRVEDFVYRTLVGGEGHGERLQIALGIDRIAVLVDQIAFQSPDHDLRKLLVVRQNVA